MVTANEKHALEDGDSWASHLGRLQAGREDTTEERADRRRNLKHRKRHHAEAANPKELEILKEDEFLANKEKDHAKAAERNKKLKKKRKKHIEELYADSGIQQDTVHGMIIDAGSSGSRLHLYEWDPRVLRDTVDVEAAVSGRKLSFPGTETRWTERLQPGISTFSTIDDPDDLHKAIKDYLQPLIDFAVSILHEKKSDFKNFRIYLRATAGMRILDAENRSRIMEVVRELFSDSSYCPFYFEPEQARTLSGEEEAIYDWLGVNFLSTNGEMLRESEGSGTVTSPRSTFGALDLGGASTQISFYEQNEDIMANLFKLQIGQGKHWNVYTHSHLFYGINEATNRFEARLAHGESTSDRLIKGVSNPCLPGGSQRQIRTDIHINENGIETWDFDPNSGLQNGFYQAILKNEEKTSDYETCNTLVRQLLHMEQNAWCNFDHKGDCSFAGVYQPKLPAQSERFGEFLAFSNYVRIWDYLELPERASIGQLENATKHVCSMSKEETFEFNNGRVDTDAAEQSCFRSVYAMNLLKGYGFQDHDFITAKKVINGHKVGWAIGAMLYEINALPWEYEKPEASPLIAYGHEDEDFNWVKYELFCVVLLASFAAFLYRRRQGGSANSKMYQYEPVKDVDQM